MLILEPMTNEIFVSYIAEAVAHFSSEFVTAGICDELNAVATCRATYEKSLPYGLSTPNNFLYEIRKIEGQITIGMVWLAIWMNAGKRSAFICDVYIRPEWRNLGYGTQTMQLLENKIREFKDVSEIGLHVLWHNKIAQSIYEKLGFKPTGVNMIKLLDVDNSGSITS